jgi:hypothetical protein
MLVIALFLDKHKKTLTDDSRRTIESTWVARFKEKLVLLLVILTLPWIGIVGLKMNMVISLRTSILLRID